MPLLWLISVYHDFFDYHVGMAGSIIVDLEVINLNYDKSVLPKNHSFKLERRIFTSSLYLIRMINPLTKAKCGTTYSLLNESKMHLMRQLKKVKGSTLVPTQN